MLFNGNNKPNLEKFVEIELSNINLKFGTYWYKPN